MASTSFMTFTPKILTGAGLVGATEVIGAISMEVETNFRARWLPIKFLISISSVRFTSLRS